MKRIQAFISVCILTLTCSSTWAGWFGADFSADIYMQDATLVTQHGRMFVSQGRVRTEMKQDDGLWVEIIDPLSGKAWLLDTENKLYRERVVPKDHGQENAANPCARWPQANCHAAGSEEVNGREANKWFIDTAANAREIFWLDSEHHFPVRVVVNNQLEMEMRFVGSETLASRRVERWQARVPQGQGQMITTQWYDPELNIAIKQQLPDGRVRELKNVRQGKQPDKLFKLPPGYQPVPPANNE